MKRKIPARKHHGVRDPVKQNQQRLAKIKDKINNPPGQGQEVHISYKLTQFAKLRNDVKSGKFKKFKRTVENEDKPKKSSHQRQNDNKIKPIKKLPNESDEDYLKRVNRITTESLKEAQYEVKYGVNVIHDSKTGAIEIEKRTKNEIDEILEKKKKNRKGKVEKEKKSKIDPRTAKELIKQVLKEEKEKKKTEELQEYKREIIKFGETVHAPPSLILPRKAQKDETVPRPGKKNNLLLKNLFNNDENSDAEELQKIAKTVPKNQSVVDLKGKRKELPVATRRMIEDQQIKAIEMYRQLRKNKTKS